MRLLLDESVPRRLGQHLAPHEVDSVHDRDWDGLKNGALLQAAEADYLSDLMPLIPGLFRQCEELDEGQVAVVNWRDS